MNLSTVTMPTDSCVSWHVSRRLTYCPLLGETGLTQGMLGAWCFSRGKITKTGLDYSGRQFAYALKYLINLIN